MIHWWQRRQTLKQARELVHGARKMVRMHRDILDPSAAGNILSAANGLAGAVKQRDLKLLDGAVEKLERHLEKAFPRKPYASLRENVEVFFVAIIVAMAVRTFFVQPFKIPTGSMQPTLYGVYPPPQEAPLPYHNGRPGLPAQLLGMAFQGKIYLRDGYRSRGDHIFVDRFTYHFRKPQRGEIIVFDTADITKLPESSRGKFYIKRLVGVAGDRVQIRPPYVYIDGKILNDRPSFERIYSKQNHYNGYVIPRGFPPPEVCRTPDEVFEVPPKNLFVLGDNSLSSLDGRYWGAFNENALVGKAFFVYWPFSRRFGFVN
jgi:signal peptidase I